MHTVSPRRSILVVLLMASSAVWPATASADFASDSINALDQNKDGTVNADEYVSWRLGNMARHDTDDVPGLSAEEFSRSLDERGRENAALAFNNTDVNKDGVLEGMEYGGYHRWVFTHALDTNSDGQWTDAEYRDFLAANPGLGAQRLAESIIARLDTRDRNGSVSLREYLDAQAPKFLQFDASGNGSLSRSEFKASLDGKARRRAAGSFKTFDFDSDRKLNRQEFFDYHGFIFLKVLDRNSDGQWNAEEARSLFD